MKRSILCLFMICAFSISTASPFMDLSAAELWNSSKPKGDKSKNSYYNKKPRSDNDGSPTLYNKNRPSYNKRNISNNVLRSDVRAYNNMNIAIEQRASRLWKYMDGSAIRNRQLDTNNALQREYDTRKRLRALMIETAYKRSEFRAASKKSHGFLLAKAQADKLARKQAALDRKYRALARYNDDIYSSDRKRRVYKPKTFTKKNSKGLKKPNRLFNDPNN